MSDEEQPPAEEKNVEETPVEESSSDVESTVLKEQNNKLKEKFRLTNDEKILSTVGFPKLNKFFIAFKHLPKMKKIYEYPVFLKLLSFSPVNINYPHIASFSCGWHPHKSS